MSPTVAVRTVLQKYADFSGRARRSEFWWWTLATFVLALVMSVIDRAAGSRVPSDLVGLALLVPGITVTVRRLHDTGRAGWWIFIGLVRSSASSC